MPFSGSEILEVANGVPSIGAVSGNHVVVIDAGRASPGGTLPLSGTYTVMDATVDDAKVYTGLPAALHTTYLNAAVAESGSIWFLYWTQLWRITPGVASPVLVGTNAGHTAIAALPGKIVVFGSSTCRIYDIATNSWTTGASQGPGFAIHSAVGTSGRFLTMRGDSTSYVTDNTGTVLSTLSIGGSTRGSGVAIGSKACVPRPGTQIIDVVDVLSPAPLTLSTAPYYAGRNLSVGPDGWLYTYDATTVGGRIVAVSPVTGIVDSAAPPTARGRRAFIGASANGKLYIPSGEPL